MTWSAIAAGCVVVFAALCGLAMAAITLPGVWLMIAAAIACNAWAPGLFDTRTLVVCVVLAALGEAGEFLVTALGAKRAGGSRSGTWGAVVGTMIGAIVGTFVPPPIIGTIAGAALGAGLGALLAERRFAGRSWDQAAAIGSGAALGRVLATVLKLVIALVVALVLSIAAFIP